MTATSTQATAHGPNEAILSPSAPARSALPLAGVVAGVVGVGVLSATGALAAGFLADPGVAVRWGLPAVRVAHDVLAALTVGLLVLAAVVMPRPRQRSVVEAAAAAGAGWALAALGMVVLTYSDVAGLPPSADDSFGAGLWQFASQLETGRSLTATAVLAAVTATIAVVSVSPGWVAVAAVTGLAALWPLSLGGHSGAEANHETSVTALFVHVVGVSVWVGGLAALALVGAATRGELATRAGRLSGVFGWAFLAVASSGTISAVVRVESLDGLASTYGTLVLGKIVLLAVLGVAGWAHRSRTMAIMSERPTLFWRLVAVELMVMGAATGLAVALSRTPPPERGPVAPVGSTTPAETALGYPLPPDPAGWGWVAAARPDLLWLMVAAMLAGLYLAGVSRLRRRGDSWPLGRTLTWLVGVLVLVLVTSAAPAAYGRVLFSAHMVGHMVASMVVPPLLVLGAPVTLALRALVTRRDGSTGPRELLLGLVHSRPLRVLTNPVVAAVIFTVSLFAFYHSPLFELALRTHTGHVLMNAHFLLAGYLFASALIGVDPGTARSPYPLRLVILFATMAFHAFFGVSIISSEVVLAADWFAAVRPDWAPSLLADQQTGGALAWAIGELPTLLLALGVAVAWSRDDTREARRSDRASDRDDGAELARYNAMLAARGRNGP